MMRRPYIYKSSIEIPYPKDEVFEFFKKAENLEKLTPEWLRFKILTPLPIDIKKGTIIDYKIKLMGFPFKWRTLITLWEPDVRFCDEQLKGPYKIWKHTHTFESRGALTKINDRVEYIPRGGIFAPLINVLFVSKQVEKIFAYREKKIREIFD